MRRSAPAEGQQARHRRLEALGCSFIKLATSRFLYYRLGRRVTAGRLTEERTVLVSGRHMQRLAGRLAWGRQAEELALLRGQLGWPEAELERAGAVAAVVGAVLEQEGEGRALDLLARLGLPLGAAASLQEVREARPSKGAGPAAACQASAVEEGWSPAELQELGLGDLLARLGWPRIEKILGYEFRERSFLLQAFTHPTFLEPRHAQPALTPSYEQLEFLGDAVLELVLVRHLITNTRLDFTDIRVIKTVLLSNSFFASRLTAHQLESHVLHCNTVLHDRIGEYLEAQWWDEAKPQIGHDLVELCLERDAVPKVLGDVFESILGAVYLDSGHSLSAVWAVYCRLCPDIQAIIDNPVRI
jgi:dsRNA-specific ribonuclease